MKTATVINRQGFTVTGAFDIQPVSNHFVVEGKSIVQQSFVTPMSRGRLWVDDTELSPGILKGTRPFGDELFGWGNNQASRPSALAILLHVLQDKRIALNLYRPFSEAFVSKWPRGNFSCTVDLDAFLAGHQDKLAPGVTSYFFKSPVTSLSHELEVYKDPLSGRYRLALASLAAKHFVQLDGVTTPSQERFLENAYRRLYTRLLGENALIEAASLPAVTRRAKEILSYYYLGLYGPQEYYRRQQIRKACIGEVGVLLTSEV